MESSREVASHWYRYMCADFNDLSCFEIAAIETRAVNYTHLATAYKSLTQ
jgi:hypothetical protein